MIELTEEQLEHVATIQPDTSRQTPPELLDYKLLCRQNTGISLYDSGGDHGRAWQQPPPADVLFTWDDAGCPAVLTTHMVLRDCWPIDQELTAEYWQKLEPIGQWLDELLRINADDTYILHAFMLAKGYASEGYWEETGEYENFSQPIRYCHYHRPGGPDKAAVMIHNGMDIRGGWTTPVLADPSDVCPLPCQVGYRAYRGFDAHGRPLTDAQLAESQWPATSDSAHHDMCEDIRELFKASIGGIAYAGVRKADGAFVFIHAGDARPSRHLYKLTEDAIRDQHRAGYLDSPKRKRWMKDIEQYLTIKDNHGEKEAHGILADLLALRLQNEEPR